MTDTPNLNGLKVLQIVSDKMLSPEQLQEFAVQLLDMTKYKESVYVLGNGISAYYIRSFDPADTDEDLCGTWRHYKGGCYEVIMVSTDEATGGKLVTYRSTDPAKTDGPWTRTLENFTEEVYNPDFTETLVSRFERISKTYKYLIALPQDIPHVRDGDPQSFTAIPSDKAGDFLAALGADAMKWAIAFRQTAIKIMKEQGVNALFDDGWLCGWFANAIEYPSDVRRWQREAAVKSVVTEADQDIIQRYVQDLIFTEAPLTLLTLAAASNMTVDEVLRKYFDISVQAVAESVDDGVKPDSIIRAAIEAATDK